MGYRPGVDVVVCAYHSPEDLCGFIEAFVDVQFEVPCSLHIVNVDPRQDDLDATHEALDKVLIPVSFSITHENIGYARSCNGVARGLDGLARSTLALFNADTRLAPGVLDGCHWYLSQHRDVGIVGPRQVDDFGLVTHGGIFGTFEQPALRGWKELDQGQFSDTRTDAVSVSGSAYFVRRSVWDELAQCDLFLDVAPDAQGAFLPTQHYYEETWCSYHAQAHGYRVAYLGELQMTHRWHKASPVGGFAEQQMPISQEYFRRACDHHDIPHD